MSRDKDYNKLIHTKRWVLLRREVLTAHPVCQRCEGEGRMGVPATEVHHVTPVEYGVTYTDKHRLMYDRQNLQALCHDCHVAVHKEMGKAGKAATARRVKAHKENFIKKFFE